MAPEKDPRRSGKNGDSMIQASGIPVFSCGDGTLESAFRLALETLAANTRPFRSGLLREKCPCLMAGADYPSPWTRDAAINVWFAEALLDPGTARNTLLGVLEERLSRAELSGLKAGGKEIRLVIHKKTEGENEYENLCFFG